MLRAQDVERTRFVSTVAHELRTPLTGLGGYLELILSDSVDDPAVERGVPGAIAATSSRRWTSWSATCSSSRGSSRAASRLDVDAFSVAEIGQRVLDHLAPIALQRSVPLTSQLPPRIRAARGDRRRVEQILKNLLGNALKFTPSGGSVELAGWFDGPVAVLAVRDDGIGIADDDRVRIFERFYRMASHERINGTGLGLPIARELARAMGGDLDVASVPRAGSSFVLVLPGPDGRRGIHAGGDPRSHAGRGAQPTAGPGDAPPTPAPRSRGRGDAGDSGPTGSAAAPRCDVGSPLHRRERRVRTTNARRDRPVNLRVLRPRVADVLTDPRPLRGGVLHHQASGPRAWRSTVYPPRLRPRSASWWISALTCRRARRYRPASAPRQG